jgi:hypothetical protein
MTLAGWQVALAELVGGRPIGDGPLTSDEHRWLKAVRDTPGFEVTVQVRQWWRRYRVASCAPLTLEVLGSQREAVLDAYLAAFPEPTSFYVREATRFLGYVAATRTAAHLASVTGFEAAMLQAAQGQPAAEPLVAFRAPPAVVLTALVTGTQLPEPHPSRTWWLWVSPQLPRLCAEVDSARSA